MFKRCRRCGLTKGLGEFRKRRGARDGRQARCKACVSEYDKAYRRQNLDKCRAYRRAYYKENRGKCLAYAKAYSKENRERLKACALRRKYDLTPEERDAMVKDQDRRCAICRRRRALCVDHCHRSGRVRGLLCRMCNIGIGHLGDDPDLTEAATTYLRKA